MRKVKLWEHIEYAAEVEGPSDILIPLSNHTWKTEKCQKSWEIAIFSQLSLMFQRRIETAGISGTPWSWSFCPGFRPSCHGLVLPSVLPWLGAAVPLAMPWCCRLSCHGLELQSAVSRAPHGVARAQVTTFMSPGCRIKLHLKWKKGPKLQEIAIFGLVLPHVF